MWSRLEADPQFLEQFKRAWLIYSGGPQPSLQELPPDDAHAYPGLVGIVDQVAGQVRRDVQKLRARGGDVVFVRFPSSGPVYTSEIRGFPRALSWEPLLRRSHATGVNFADYPQLQGYNLPEWSHMSAADAPRFTRALATVIVCRIAHPQSPSQPYARCETKDSDFGVRWAYR